MIWGQIFTFDIGNVPVGEFMARPLRIAYPNAYYHVTCRGNDRRDIYKDDQDRRLFFDKLKPATRIGNADWGPTLNS
jgi:hypothetical protein